MRRSTVHKGGTGGGGEIGNDKLERREALVHGREWRGDRRRYTGEALEALEEGGEVGDVTWGRQAVVHWGGAGGGRGGR